MGLLTSVYCASASCFYGSSSVIVFAEVMPSGILAVICLVSMLTFSSATEPVRSYLAINARNILEDGFGLF